MDKRLIRTSSDWSIIDWALKQIQNLRMPLSLTQTVFINLLQNQFKKDYSIVGNLTFKSISFKKLNKWKRYSANKIFQWVIKHYNHPWQLRILCRSTIYFLSQVRVCMTIKRKRSSREKRRRKKRTLYNDYWWEFYLKN